MKTLHILSTKGSIRRRSAKRLRGVISTPEPKSQTLCYTELCAEKQSEPSKPTQNNGSYAGGFTDADLERW